MTDFELLRAALDALEFVNRRVVWNKHEDCEQWVKVAELPTRGIRRRIADYEAVETQGRLQ